MFADWDFTINCVCGWETYAMSLSEAKGMGLGHSRICRENAPVIQIARYYGGELDCRRIYDN